MDVINGLECVIELHPMSSRSFLQNLEGELDVNSKDLEGKSMQSNRIIN